MFAAHVGASPVQRAHAQHFAPHTLAASLVQRHDGLRWQFHGDVWARFSTQELAALPLTRGGYEFVGACQVELSVAAPPRRPPAGECDAVRHRLARCHERGARIAVGCVAHVLFFAGYAFALLPVTAVGEARPSL